MNGDLKFIAVMIKCIIILLAQHLLIYPVFRITQQILKQLISRKGDLHRFEVSTPSLNEIFLQVVGRKQ